MLGNLCELIQRVSSAFTSAGERSGMSASEQLRFSWLEYGVLVTCSDNIVVFSQSEKWESSNCEILKKIEQETILSGSPTYLVLERD